MHGPRDYIEVAAAWLFANQKGRDAKAFTKSAPFTSHPTPTIRIASPDYPAAAPSKDGIPILRPEHMHGVDEFPALEWDDYEGVKQWLVIVEDPDAPLPTPICHAIYMGIPKEKRSIAQAEMEIVDEKNSKTKGGFHYGKNLYGVVYVPPRPLINHGMHRYFYDVIALKEPLDTNFIKTRPSRQQVGEAINGKVLAWGRWMGQCERLWE